MKLNIYDITGKKSGEVNSKISKLKESVNKDLVNQYLRVYMQNQRQGTSSTLSRSMITGGGKKPWKQKGTGRARAGSNRSPLWVGGAVIHGPKPKSWNIKITKKMALSAKRSIVYTLTSDKRVVLFDIAKSFDKKISTKKASEFLNKLSIKGKVLVINDDNINLYKSLRNIKDVRVKTINNTNVYDLAYCDYVLVNKNKLSELEKALKL